MGTWTTKAILFSALTFTFLMSTNIFPYHIEARNSDGTAKVTIEDDFDRFRQFNTDITVWVNEAKKFPDNLNKNITRINRPLYLAISALASRINHIIKHFPDLQTGMTRKLSIELTFHSMLFLNYLSLIAIIFLYHAMLKYYFDESISIIAALMLALSSMVVRRSMLSSPEIMGLLVTLLILYLYDRYMLKPEHPTWLNILGFALIVGFLFLIKAHYHVLIAILLWSLYSRRWRVFWGILIVHFVPLLLWIAWLKSSQINYYNHEAESYRQIVWVRDYISTGRLLDVLPDAMQYASVVLQKVIIVFTPQTLFLAIWAYATRGRLNQRGRYAIIIYITGLVIFLTLLKRAPDYLVFDLYIFIYPLVAIALVNFKDWLNQASRLTQKINLTLIVFVYLVTETLFSWYLVFNS